VRFSFPWRRVGRCVFRYAAPYSLIDSETSETSDMSVNFYQTTRRNKPENSHLDPIKVLYTFSATALHDHSFERKLTPDVRMNKNVALSLTKLANLRYTNDVAITLRKLGAYLSWSGHIWPDNLLIYQKSHLYLNILLYFHARIKTYGTCFCRPTASHGKITVFGQ
jgi:hypothetical protein